MDVLIHFLCPIIQKIWDEIGESDNERDKMLLELEQECLDIYRRKVENTRKYKADLYQVLAEHEAEIAKLTSALGERASFSRVSFSFHNMVIRLLSVLTVVTVVIWPTFSSL